jgi:hypothetical protein
MATPADARTANSRAAPIPANERASTTFVLSECCDASSRGPPCLLFLPAVACTLLSSTSPRFLWVSFKAPPPSQVPTGWGRPPHGLPSESHQRLGLICARRQFRSRLIAFVPNPCKSFCPQESDSSARNSRAHRSLLYSRKSREPKALPPIHQNKSP